eukprot:gene48514-43592_t
MGATGMKRTTAPRCGAEEVEEVERKNRCGGRKSGAVNVCAEMEGKEWNREGVEQE